MSKRKFSLGDIVRKLNQEKGEVEHQEPPRESHIHDSTQGNSNTPENQRNSTPANDIQNEERSDFPFPQQPNVSKHTSGNPTFVSTTKAVPDLTAQEIHRTEHTPTHLQKNATTIQQEPPKADSLDHHEKPSPFAHNHQHKDPATSLHSNIVPRFENHEDEEESIDLLKYVAILFRRRYIIVAITLISAMFSIYRYSTSEKYYTTSARLLFSPDVQDLTGDSRYYYFWGDREKQFNTHLELLKSPSVLKMVSENLGNTINPSAIGASLGITQGETNGEKNDIIEISFKNNDPTITRDVLNELCRTYIDYRREVNSQEISRLVFKFETQINKLQNELDTKESDLRRFKEDNQLVQLSSETNTAVTKLADMELALQKTNLDLIESKERLTSLNSQIGKQDLDIVQSITYQDPLKNRLAELELELNTLSAEYSTEHFKVKMLKQQIELLKAAAVDSMSREAASKTFVKNPIRQSLLQEYINLVIEKSALETKRIAQEKIIERLNFDLLKLPSLEQKFAFLQRETESLLQTLRMLKGKFEEAKIKRDSQESDLKLLEMAETPQAAIRKVKSTVIFIGILVGLLIGIAIALIFEYFDQSLKDPLEVEKTLELPLLGIVPHIEADQELFEQKDLSKNIFEPFRALRANLKHIATAHKLKTFIICSAVKGEGKTTLSANLSITFAMDDKKVILIDADLRRSQMHTLFSIPKKIGLADYLLGTATIDDILKPTKYPNLFIVTSGERPNNPAELLGTWRFDKLIEELRLRGDIVIFDSPALLPVSDTITMAPKMDGCLVVVRTLWTPVKAAKQAKNQLKRIGCKIFGGILNGVTHSRGYYPYYYGYYGYYSYKYSYDDETHKKSSLREFGLSIERGLKSHIKSIWYGIPKYVAKFGTFFQFSVSKPLLWILVLIISILVIVQISFESKIKPVFQDTVQYIGLGAPSQNGVNDSQRVFTDITDMQHHFKHDEDTNFVEVGNLKDSITLWLLNRQNNNIEGLLSFYHNSFKFSNGSITEWKEQLKLDLEQQSKEPVSFTLRNIRKIKQGADYIEVEIRYEENRQSESIETTIGMIWRKSEKGWKIIRELKKSGQVH